MRQTEELWIDKYKPLSSGELAVHKKKVGHFSVVATHTHTYMDLLGLISQGTAPSVNIFLH